MSAIAYNLMPILEAARARRWGSEKELFLSKFRGCELRLIRAQGSGGERDNDIHL